MNPMLSVGESSSESLFSDLDIPVIKYEYDNSGVTSVISANDDFQTEFAGDPTVADHPPTYPLPSGQSKEISEPKSHIPSEGHIAQVQQIEPAGTVGSDRYVVLIKTERGERLYIRNRMEIESNVCVDVYADVTKTTQQEKYISVLQRLLRHNLRNDLNVIEGYANTILNSEDAPPEIRKQAKHIATKAESLSSMSYNTKIINEVIDASSGLAEFDLTPVVDDVISKHRSRNPEATIEYNTSSSYDILATHRVEALVDNLVENGIEHNTGDVKVTVSIDRNDHEAVTLSVSDNGLGMPPIERKVITGETEITNLSHGSGLGLWVVRWIADQCGAKLEFKPTENKGSTVCVTFQTPAK